MGLHCLTRLCVRVFGVNTPCYKCALCKYNNVYFLLSLFHNQNNCEILTVQIYMCKNIVRL